MTRLIRRLTPTWILARRRRRAAIKSIALTHPWNAAGAYMIGVHLRGTRR